MLHLGLPPRVKNKGLTKYAGMLESVDWTDLGSVVVRRVGSSPTARTRNRQTSTKEFFDFLLPYTPSRSCGTLVAEKWQARSCRIAR